MWLEVLFKPGISVTMSVVITYVIPNCMHCFYMCYANVLCDYFIRIMFCIQVKATTLFIVNTRARR